MADIFIITLQISSPFILLGLLLTWIYRLHKEVARLTLLWESSLSDSESLWRRIREGEDGIYKKIGDIEEHIEAMDDVFVEVLHDTEGRLRGNKTKPKAK